MLRALRVALPAAWVLALVLTLVFARSAVLPTLILGALVVSAWWAAFGSALGSRPGSHRRTRSPAGGTPEFAPSPPAPRSPPAQPASPGPPPTAAPGAAAAESREANESLA